MDPIVIVPVALAVAWAATRNKKKTTKKTELPSVTDEPPKELPPPPTHDDPFGPYDGPGGDEPYRPGGPGQGGPKPFPGPKGGPKPPEYEDPAPIEIYPGTTADEIEQHDNAGYGLFISSDCETVYEGESWYTDVFLPKARELVLGDPDAFHHPVAVIYEILVAMPTGEGFSQPEGKPHRDHVVKTDAAACVAAWAEIVYGGYTPLGTYSGWINDPYDESWDYYDWFKGEYPDLSDLLYGLAAAMWNEPDLVEIFDLDWPEDTADGDIDFEPTEE
jgi:hypothetical protein